MTRTGIFGGSFNPIHNGHISLAFQIISRGALDEIWFMVSPQNPLKHRASLVTDKIRFKMVETALREYPALKACDYELHLPQPSYTWDTLNSMSVDFPNNKLVLLIGADNWQCIQQWYKYEDIISNYDIIIYPRRGYCISQSELPKNVSFIDSDLFDISSTEIRQRIKKKEGIEGLVPPGVERIIKEETLYE